ncbi:MAG TPA: SDR family oxidoreductase [Bryobacteraceae bacterium]|jgi:nucleoside-diphosphate-sugar epimerase|nr:SDR family oxidoreductase [Bryobacteraceae bacterium]
MKNYVVTGGAGFIGSALVRTLLKSGGHVAVIDNLLSGHEKNLAEIRDRIDFHNLDIRDAAAIAPVIAGADAVFHLAAIPSVPKSIDEPQPSHEVNIDGTFAVFTAAANGKARRLVYAASSSAYGDGETLPKIETMLPKPLSPYAVQKYVGELYASVFTSCFGLETVSLRFFNVYGPRQDPSSAYSGILSLFMKHLIARTPPTIFGDGEQSRDFTYVDDVAALCLKAANAPGAAGKMFNAGNGGRYTLNQVWSMLQKMEGVDIPAKFGPPRAGDVRHSMADTTLAVAELGHAPQYSLEEGLRKTLDWYKTSL